MKNKIILASDSFKGSLTSLEVGRAAARAVKAVMPEMGCEIVPVADGGEGTVEAVVSALKGEFVTARVTGPLGEPVEAVYGVCGDTAVIEMAAASGLPLVPTERRNPWLTTSFGTGELIRDALGRGCRRFLVGIGGSATNDAGVGMLMALGFRFYDADGREVGRGGGEVGRIVAVDESGIVPSLKESEFIVACDVTNPLTGLNGASHVFGPQKGADPAMVDKLDACLEEFARVIAGAKGNDFSTRPGAGAAGGLGFAFLAFLGARLEPGIEMVLNAVGFDKTLEDGFLVVTGEGRLDSQTCMGKTPYGVLKRALARGIPTVAIGGAIVPDAVPALIEAGFSAVFPIVAGPVELSEALKPEVAAANVERTVGQILRTIKITK